MDIAITFDIEFDINGAFREPEVRRPRGQKSLVCMVGGVDIGLGRILDILDAYQHKATFFVDALQTAWFGLDEMGEVARLLHQRGHELQLHLHPIWLRFENPDWASLARERRPSAARDDSLLAVSEERGLEIVQQGLDVFAAWGVPKPSVVRTGSLIMARRLYKVFRACGLMVSSSVGCGIYQPRDPDMTLYSAPRRLDGVLEIPVSTYLGADGLLRSRRRLATIVGMGVAEQRALFAEAQRKGVAQLVVLSHVSEFVKFSDSGAPSPVGLTLHKFKNLVKMIAQSEDLQAVTFTELAEQCASRTDFDDIRVQVSRVLSAVRFLDRVIPRRG